MRNVTLKVVLRSGILALFVVAESFSQWSTDSTVNTAVSIAFADQTLPAITTDGAGGAIIVWADDRALSSIDIYAQRIDASGNVLWTADGVAICTAANDQNYPAIVSDGSGGAVIAWMDMRSGNYDIYAQRVDAAGTVQWATNGVALSTAIGNQDFPTIISDGSGGAIVGWEDFRTGISDIYARRIDGSGAAQWTANGTAVCTASGQQVAPIVVSDGAGGAIFAWYDYRNGSTADIYTQRLDASGAGQWLTNGVVVCGAADNQFLPVAISDGVGGAIIVWNDLRNGATYDVYAQRIDASGVVQWAANGLAVCSDPANQDSPVIVGDGSGGGIIAWEDYRNGGTADVYAQRINGSGASQWTTNGVPVCVAANYQDHLSIVADGAHGAIVSWDDQRAGNYDVYAQLVNAAGAVQWQSNGAAISTASSNQRNSVMVGDGAGGAIVAWQDSRSSQYDVYASKIFSNGTLPVELVSFDAQAKDEGVLLEWKTASEANNYGWQIDRLSLNNEQSLTNSWTEIGFVDGAGTSTMPKNYSITDKEPRHGKYHYRLKQIDRNGEFKYSQEVEVDVIGAPNKFALNQNYPNPFNPTTNLRFSIAEDQLVRLELFDILGRKVGMLVNEKKSAGNYSVKWDAAGLPSGTYIYRLTAGNFTAVKKMILMK